jgi:5-phospho-D-xylono-1,4-lactonase
MPIIRTVCGDISPEALGVTLMHEHVLTAPPPVVADPDFTMDSEAVAIRELGHFRSAGGVALVEMTTRDYGRDALGLRRVSAASGVQIICAAGWQKERFSREAIGDRSINDLADEIIREVCAGIDGGPVRAGVIKASSSLDTITPGEEKALRAAARAQRETGALISTHTEAGTMAREQVALLRSEGVDPSRILIGHLDRRMDYEYHLELVRSGVTIGYDQIGKEKYAPDALRAEFVLRLAEAGYAAQIALSGDMARRSSWPSYGGWGGPGLTHITWRFAPWLRERGMDDETLAQILVQSPARLLAIPVGAQG